MRLRRMHRECMLPSLDPALASVSPFAVTASMREAGITYQDLLDLSDAVLRLIDVESPHPRRKASGTAAGVPRNRFSDVEEDFENEYDDE